MASAFKDKHGWIADFRGLFAPGRKRRRVRIPEQQLVHGDIDQAARAFAAECERYCRLLEGSPGDSQIDHAVELGAVTKAQAHALREGLPMPIDAPKSHETHLMECWQAHPSTQREERNGPAEYDKHYRNLKRFIAWSGIVEASDLRLPTVQRWIDYLKGEGYEYSTRRHHLVPIRRAAMMGARLHGFIDPVARLKLDEDSDPPPVEVWTLAELAQTGRLLRGPRRSAGTGHYRPGRFCRTATERNPAGPAERTGRGCVGGRQG